MSACGMIRNRILLGLVCGCMVAGRPRPASAADNVSGNLILFNDNGAWCWYQDERTIVDQAGGTMLIGSVAASQGLGGSARGGDVDVVSYCLATGRRQRATLHENLQQDDHDTAAFLIRPDGRYLAMYARHNSDLLSRYRISLNPHDAGAWGPARTFDWITINSDFNVTYSNLFYLSAEKRTYNFARADNRSPNMLLSSDQGDTWSYGGRLLYTPVNVGYVNGYLKYASDGVSRIHFVATEHHPRDYNNSIYHGYIEAGKMYRSDGTLLDEDIFDNYAPRPADLTVVFAAGTVVNGDLMTRAWPTDLQVDAAGRPYAIFSCRANDVPDNTNGYNDHRFFYGRFDGARWRVYPLAKAGARLFTSEQDYTGLAALHPHDPDQVYISTPVDPRSGVDLPNHEIFHGVTSDGGQTWSWTPVTQNSGVDNYRPIIPSWSAQNLALLWYRGTVNSAGSYDAAVVGVLDRRGERVASVHYVDAMEGGGGNTTLADGGPLVPTTGSGRGPADGNWHRRTGYGNGGSVLASSELAPEDAPTLKTTLAGLGDGTYDVFALFWANPAEDWRIVAGLAPDQMLIFREMASQQAEASQFDGPITLAGGGNTALYRAYVGRVKVTGGAPVAVYIDDQSSVADGRDRTWYDGLGYARVTCSADLDGDADVDGDDLAILRACFTGPTVPGPADGCSPVQFTAADADDDHDVDQSDFGSFQGCWSGPVLPADPGCET